jgi:NAD(P)H-flavin reductase
VIRLEPQDTRKSWAVGQHYFLTFPALTIWQSHPFTVASVPGQHHYIIRCRKGETGRLKMLANQTSTTSEEIPTLNQTPVVLCGPYGTALLKPKSEPTNILAIAGGTGVSLALPIVLAATASNNIVQVAVDFIWIIRRQSNLQWIARELDELKRRASSDAINFRVHVYVIQEMDDT